MQTNRIKQFLVATNCLLVGVLASCSDITDMHREFLDRGETTYAGKIDSIKVRGGLGRVQIEGLSRYAKTAEKCYVSWNDQHKEFLLKDIIDGEKVKILLPGIEEGAYYFYVQTEDKDGNLSLKEECSGSSYGDEYKLSKIKKIVAEQKAEPSGLLLKWSLSEDAVKVDLIYDNTQGGKTQLVLPGDVTETRLTDWALGGEIKALTYTLPETNALDTIALDPFVSHFIKEVEYEVNKANFKAVSLPTDTKGNGYGGKLSGIWDGIKGSGEGNRYHSVDGEGVPHHLTFDMGVQAHFTRFEIVGRENYNSWNPKRFQIWGIDSLEGAETTLPSSDPGWEAEAQQKGWTLLIDATCNDPVTNTFKLDKDKVKNVRYIRYRVLEVFGPPAVGSGAYGCVQEMTFWADELVSVE